MDTFITIVLLIVLLLLLIGLHELGHFAVAKMCNVYCAEFSIGFGPKLFSFKRKKGETTFTVRGLPIGGYVSMYGEEGELEEGEYIPKERSLEGIHKGKKCAVLLAGVVMNFLLTFVFCYAYALCFPSYSVLKSPNYGAELSYSNGYLTRTYNVSEEGVSETNTPVGVVTMVDDNDSPKVVTDVDFPFYAGLVLSHQDHPDSPQYGGYIFDTQVTITVGGEAKDVVALFNPSTVVSESNLVDSLYFYDAVAIDAAKANAGAYAGDSSYGGSFHNPIALGNEELSAVGITALPSFTATQEEVSSGTKLSSGAYTLSGVTEISFHVNTLNRREVTRNGESAYVLDVSTYRKNSYTVRVSTDIDGNRSIATGGLRITPHEVWYSAGQRVSNGNQLWCNLWVNMGAGLYALFTGNFGSLSGPIGIGSALGTVAATSGWAYSFFYLGALVSLNLAILNLFPFPGLDGWQLLTTGYEAITKKKIKDKTKAIVSYIGLGLLLVLAIYIMVMDIVRLF